MAEGEAEAARGARACAAPRRAPSSRRLGARAPLLAASALCALGGLGACGTNSPTYFPAGAPLEIGADRMEASGTVALDFREPSEGEAAEREALSSRLGYQVPWLREDDVHVSIRYTVTNLGDTEGTFFIRVAGASELVRYDEAAIAAAFEAANQETDVFGLIEMPPGKIGPGEVYQGEVREDDLHEAALDLDAMGRWGAPFASVLLNRSDVNRVGLEMMPANAILPAFWELTLHLAASTPMTCNFIVRVRDDRGQLREGAEAAFVPAPATFTPEVAAAAQAPGAM